MVEGPLGGPRPLATPSLEVNVYFGKQPQRKDDAVDVVEKAAGRVLHGVDSVTGMHGSKNNVISIGVKGNQITYSQLEELKHNIGSTSAASDIVLGGIEEIEIIG